ncbi:hypothetical protein CBR_g57065 [Chara braunii]|uniref:Uncharacterized protein n=1 Tax=Chara braunii TaxID=69332 RepID=A0A388K7Z8_CHABU|nr:hypothetical protein CBR_g57065 [Chara braunii]|eukprot:GBG66184.1 hypothetical protein CBR_g57065 [Chara braunii]
MGRTYSQQSSPGCIRLRGCTDSPKISDCEHTLMCDNMAVVVQVLSGKEPRRPVLLDKPIEMVLTGTEEQGLLEYRARLEEWGWRYRVSAQVSNLVQRCRSASQPCRQVATIFAVPLVLGVPLKSGDLKEHLHQAMAQDGLDLFS